MQRQNPILTFLLLAGAVFAAGCGRTPKVPRLVFHAGVEIWGVGASVVTQDSSECLAPVRWKRNSVAFKGSTALALEVRQNRRAGRDGHVWELHFVLANRSADRNAVVRAVVPVRAEEKRHGFLEFSTGEAVRVRCATGEDGGIVQILQPGQTVTLRCDSLAVFQPVSRVAVLFSVAPDTAWSIEWTLRRQKGHKRQYDFVLWEKPSRSLFLAPGQEVELPPVTVRVLTGGHVVPEAFDNPAPDQSANDSPR